MKVILQEKNTYILKVGVGEEVLGALKAFCRKEGIEAAHFSCIGAASEAELWWYDLKRKEYEKKIFQTDLEIVSMTGNIALKEGEIIVHAHGVMADREYKTVGGHIASMVISGAGEIVLEKMSGRMDRAYDEETGLHLLK